MYADGMRPCVGRTPTASKKWPGHDPIALPKRTKSGQNGRPFGGSCIGVGLTSGTAVKETDYRQTPTSPSARWMKLEKRRG